jgi:hypothetical protein
MTRPAEVMTVLTESDLLAVWETGLGQSRVRRALGLAVAGGADPSSVADLTVGQREAVVLALRESCFGHRLPCAVTCPECAEQLEVDLTVDDVRAEVANGDTTIVAGDRELRVRPVTSRDLLSVDAGRPDARELLLSRCVAPAEVLTARELDAVATALSTLDPQADVLVPLDCPACGHRWSAPFDAVNYLWIEIEAYARRLLLDVHTLACAYGWTEADVLAVSPARRLFYLEAAS